MPKLNIWLALFAVTLIGLPCAPEVRATAEPARLSGAESDIVAGASEISDFEAQLLMARLLSYSDRDLTRSAAEYRLLVAERPNDPRLRMEFARVLIRQKAYPPAIDQLRQILRQTPGDVQALAALARIYLWTDRPKEALRLLDPLQKSRVLAVELQLELARAYTQNKQYDEALDTYQEALKRVDRPDAELYTAIGDVYLYSKRLSRAVLYYRKALELSPEDLPTLKKLALALSWSGQNEDALILLEELHNKTPFNREVELELGRVYAKLGRTEEAVKGVQQLLAQNPDDPGLMMDLADLEIALGHVKRAQQLYERAIQLTGRTQETELRYAAQRVNWGDFYRTIGIYRRYLEIDPSDSELLLRLAGVLTSAQRYEEAEGIYRRLLHAGKEEERARLGLARLYMQRKNFATALENVDSGLQLVQRADAGGPENREATDRKMEELRLEGDLFYRLGRYQEALNAYSRLQQQPSGEAAGLLGRGKTLLAAGDSSAAAVALGQAERLDPKDIEIRYYLAIASGRDVDSERFTMDLLNSRAYSARQLLRWGRLYAEHGAYPQAIELFEAALADDPQNFYARFELAETLAIDHRYEKSIELLKALVKDFPRVSKLLLTYARVLAWARQYEPSLAVYAEIHQLDPTDPLPQKEAARTAIWGKRMAQGQEYYRKLWQSPVDEQLLHGLQAIYRQTDDPSLGEMLGELEASRQENSVYTSYESYVKRLPELGDRVGPQLKARLEKLSLDLLPEYQVQKGASLDAESKWLAWNRRFAQAAETHQELIEFEEGNEEALFDYAQVLCALGSCDEAGRAYEQLLKINPLHTHAALALERQRIRRHPEVMAGYSYWEEKGYGELSQVRRQHAEITADIPLRCRYHLQFTAHRWLEEPTKHNGSYLSYGHTIAFSGVVSSYLEGSAAWTRHYYEDSEVGDQNTGFARIAVNLKDYARLELGYDRSNQFFNKFAILQGVQADAWWLTLSSFVRRDLELRMGARYLNYTDDNDAQIVSLGAAYAFTDHPRVLKLDVLGEYRDTRKTNVYHYVDSELVDITHPYWAPQNYFAGTVGLEWYHDLSRLLFCGSELHYYRMRLSGGSDSDDNPLVAFEAEWHYEFADHWTAQLKGLIHRSQKWDANGLWATLQYRF